MLKRSIAEFQEFLSRGIPKGKILSATSCIHSGLGRPGVERIKGQYWKAFQVINFS